MSIDLVGVCSSCELTTPEYGYASEMGMPLVYCKHKGAQYGVYDAGTSYDTRACIGAIFNLDADTMDTLSTMLLTNTKGRGNTLTLSLGTDSGFYPFGPDLGDSGDFTVRIMRFVPGGQQHSPWKYWRPIIDMQWISGPTPAYSITDNMADGTVQVGNVAGLRYPQSGYDAAIELAVNNIITQGSDAYEVDNGVGADDYESDFEFSGNQGKMAALVNELITNVRGATTGYIAPAFNYPFGRDKGATGTFTVQMLYSTREDARAIMSVVHERFDNFTMKNRMRFVSVA